MEYRKLYTWTPSKACLADRYYSSASKRSPGVGAGVVGAGVIGPAGARRFET